MLWDYAYFYAYYGAYYQAYHATYYDLYYQQSAYRDNCASYAYRKLVIWEVVGQFLMYS